MDNVSYLKEWVKREDKNGTNLDDLTQKVESLIEENRKNKEAITTLDRLNIQRSGEVHAYKELIDKLLERISNDD